MRNELTSVRHAPTAQQVLMTKQICAGMQYLESKKLVHGYLSAYASIPLDSDWLKLIADLINTILLYVVATCL